MTCGVFSHVGFGALCPSNESLVTDHRVNKGKTKNRQQLAIKVWLCATCDDVVCGLVRLCAHRLAGKAIFVRVGREMARVFGLSRFSVRNWAGSRLTSRCFGCFLSVRHRCQATAVDAPGGGASLWWIGTSQLIASSVFRANASEPCTGLDQLVGARVASASCSDFKGALAASHKGFVLVTGSRSSMVGP